MEAIPGIGARIYSWIHRISPVSKKLFHEIAEEITSQHISGAVLDIGTGPGSLVLEIAKLNPGIEVVGIDMSKEMIAIAYENKNRVLPEGHVEFQVANASSIPFADEYFDFIVSTMSMHHWAEPEKCLKELARVLKKNGIVWIYDIRRDATAENTARIRKKYGWFLAHIVLPVVRLHSSLTLKNASETISASSTGLSITGIAEKAFLLRIEARHR